MQLNATDKGKRKFIMVQMAGKTNNAEYPTICEIGKERIRRAGENIKKTVGKINMQRRLEELSLSEKPKGLIFEKAYKEVTDFSSEMYDTEDLDTGFKVFKLDTSCIKIWDGQRATPHDLMFKFHDIIDSVKDDRTPTEVVYELALKLGVPLDMKIQTQEIMGKTIYSVENGLIMFCLANDITSDLVDKMCDNEPATIILSESGMASDTDLSNAYYICHDKGIELKLV
jgi:adenine-specific DNA-methyltransferase